MGDGLLRHVRARHALVVRREDHEGKRHLAVGGLGPADHRRFADEGQLLQHPLDLGGRDRLAADLDDVARPVGEMDEPCGVHRDAVAGAKQALRIESLGGGLRVAKVLLEERQTADAADQ